MIDFTGLYTAAELAYIAERIAITREEALPEPDAVCVLFELVKVVRVTYRHVGPLKPATYTLPEPDAVVMLGELRRKQVFANATKRNLH